MPPERPCRPRGRDYRPDDPKGDNSIWPSPSMHATIIFGAAGRIASSRGGVWRAARRGSWATTACRGRWPGADSSVQRRAPAQGAVRLQLGGASADVEPAAPDAHPTSPVVATGVLRPPPRVTEAEGGFLLPTNISAALTSILEAATATVVMPAVGRPRRSGRRPGAR